MLDVFVLWVAVPERGSRTPGHEFCRNAGVDVVFPYFRFRRFTLETDTAFENRIVVPFEHALRPSEPPVNVVCTQD